MLPPSGRAAARCGRLAVSEARSGGWVNPVGLMGQQRWIAGSESACSTVAIHNSDDNTVPFLLTRVSDTSYQMIGEYADDVPELGAFVDVYPLDGLGNDFDKAIEIKHRCREVIALSYSRAGHFSADNAQCGFFKRIAKKIQSLIMGDPKRYEKKQLDLLLANSFDESVFVGDGTWGGHENKTFVHRRDEFGIREASFEGEQFFIPTGFDPILRVNYGDYMALPSEDNRVPHHQYSITVRK